MKQMITLVLVIAFLIMANLVVAHSGLLHSYCSHVSFDYKTCAFNPFK